MESLASSILDTLPVTLGKRTADMGINPNMASQRQKCGGLETVNRAGRHYPSEAPQPGSVKIAQMPRGALLRDRARIESRARN